MMYAVYVRNGDRNDWKCTTTDRTYAVRLARAYRNGFVVDYTKSKSEIISD